MPTRFVVIEAININRLYKIDEIIFEVYTVLYEGFLSLYSRKLDALLSFLCSRYRDLLPEHDSSVNILCVNLSF